jgi:uncharacterized membrane protein (DUF2068 family)
MHKIKRPVIITILCIIGYFWIIFAFPGVFAPEIKRSGIFMPAVLGLIVAAQFISFIGLWHMKKWGAELFIISFFAKICFFFLLDKISTSVYIGIVLSIIMIVFYLIHYKKMDRNL